MKKQELEAAIARFQAQDLLVQNIERSLPNLEASKVAAEAAVAPKQAEKNRLDRMLATARGDHANAEAAVQPAVDNEARLRRELDAAQTKLNDLLAKIRAAHDELGLATSEHAAITGDIAQIEENLRLANEKVIEVGRQKADSEERIRLARQKADASKDAAERARANPPTGKIAKLRAAVRTSPDTIAAKDAEALQDALGFDTTLQAHLDNANRDVGVHTADLAGKQQPLADAARKVDEKRRAHSDLTAQEAGLRTAHTDAAALHATAVTELQTARDLAARKLSEKTLVENQHHTANREFTDALSAQTLAREAFDRETTKLAAERQKREELKIAAEEADKAVKRAEREQADRKAIGDLAQVASIEATLGDNAGKLDNFTAKQVADVIKILSDQLKHEGGWGADNFHYEIAKTADRITFDNRLPDGKRNPVRRQIIVNPRLLSIRGDMDDETIQAALIAADSLWGGVRIKAWDPHLKSRMLANAEHLYKMGRIKKYQGRTFWGMKGEGFGDANKEVTAPRDSWSLGTPFFSTYRMHLDSIENGIDSRKGLIQKHWELRAKRGSGFFGKRRAGVGAPVSAPGGAGS